MYFDSLDAFLAMGGHGFYVWLSYGLMTLGLVLLIAGSRWQQQRWLQDQRRQLAHRRSHTDSGRAPVNEK